MSAKSVDGPSQPPIAEDLLLISELGRRVLGGGAVKRDEALQLFNLESRADIFELLSWANRLREHFKGNKIHLCSIVNVKAGGCSENCRFCAQSAAYQTDSPRYGLIDAEPMLAALHDCDQRDHAGQRKIDVVDARFLPQ